jgi:hypothetical protein
MTFIRLIDIIHILKRIPSAEQIQEILRNSRELQAVCQKRTDGEKRMMSADLRLTTTCKKEKASS